MDQAAASRSRSRILTEIDPHSEWIRGDEFDTLILDVTGFSKDHLKVQVEPSGSLRISGERAVNGGAGGQHWLGFLKRFDLPPGAAARDATAIKVQLDKGVLYVQVPHTIAAATGSPGERRRRRRMAEPDEDELQEEETGGGAAAAGWSAGGRAVARRDGHPARQLARALSKHRQAVLNVVIAVVLLWLVAFSGIKPSSGLTKNK
ncbi:22.0 kDa class IV heat shock protein-like [Oryza brachyantha]|uniref:22.0 kDa class IV heat shock protein-like n=1 Tax=Oryza brachyantha TaxID=4533 RepID=UPI001AD96518|nr:22.0 kDa class IV heat shock protein-like [Oryza brachyantha]